MSAWCSVVGYAINRDTPDFTHSARWAYFIKARLFTSTLSGINRQTTIVGIVEAVRRLHRNILHCKLMTVIAFDLVRMVGWSYLRMRILEVELKLILQAYMIVRTTTPLIATSSRCLVHVVEASCQATTCSSENLMHRSTTCSLVLF
jgi:hypothetical protein